MRQVKIILIGEAGAGKTEFRKRVTQHDVFNPYYESTWGMAFNKQPFKKNEQYNWELFDVTGQLRSQTMAVGFLEKTHAVLIFVNSVHPADSINALTFLKGKTPSDAPCVVIFTKSDHKKAFEFTEANCLEHVAAVQKTLNIPAEQFSATSPYFITSAKNNMGIDEAMVSMEAAVLSSTLIKKLSSRVHSTQEQKQTSENTSGWQINLFNRKNKKQE